MRTNIAGEILQPLVIPLAVIVRHELAHGALKCLPAAGGSAETICAAAIREEVAGIPADESMRPREFRDRAEYRTTGRRTTFRQGQPVPLGTPVEIAEMRESPQRNRAS